MAASSIEPCSTSVVAEVSRTTTNFMSPRQGKHPPCQAERKRFSPFRHLPIRNRTDQSLEGLRLFTDAENVRNFWFIDVGRSTLSESAESTRFFLRSF